MLKHSQDITQLQEKCHEIETSIITQYDSHMLNLQTHANTHVNNLNELAETVTKNIQRSMAQPKKPPMHKYFNINDRVLYTDDTTGQECRATVVDIHDEDDDKIYYTVQFSNGKQPKTDSTTLI